VNASTGWDNYNTGIHLFKAINSFVSNNTIHYGSAGILLQGSNNSIIQNNTCDQISIAEKISRNIVDNYDANIACIQPTEIYKGFFGDSSESINDNISQALNYRNFNVTVTGTRYDNDTQVILRSQGTVNLTTDLVESDFYRFTAQFPTYLSSIETYYINRNFSSLIIVPNGSYSTTMLTKSWATLGNNNNRRQINWSWSNTSINFTNVNTSTRGVDLYSLQFPIDDIKINGTVVQQDVSAYNASFALLGLIEVGDFVASSSNNNAGGGGSSGGGSPSPSPSPPITNLSFSCEVGKQIFTYPDGNKTCISPCNGQLTVEADGRVVCVACSAGYNFINGTCVLNAVQQSDNNLFQKLGERILPNNWVFGFGIAVQLCH